mmetsp:Transcript_21713/g.29129  ORF Transcript_21713/g.29129 Transcript_21713/m.29129 type:complete len:165 (+) Transcript_21713:61-555(+)
MQAIICDGKGSAEVLKVGSRPIPQPSEDECLIKVEYTALNRADIMQRMGNYPPPPGVTDVLGLECLGRLVTNPAQAGTEEETLSDHRVIALLPGGGYAQYAKVHKSHCLQVPEDYEPEAAASLMEVWCTAYQILFEVAYLKQGETVLVHAAASGVGTAMIQLAK